MRIKVFKLKSYKEERKKKNYILFGETQNIRSQIFIHIFFVSILKSKGPDKDVLLVFLSVFLCLLLLLVKGLTTVVSGCGEHR